MSIVMELFSLYGKFIYDFLGDHHKFITFPGPPLNVGPTICLLSQHIKHQLMDLLCNIREHDILICSEEKLLKLINLYFRAG